MCQVATKILLLYIKCLPAPPQGSLIHLLILILVVEEPGLLPPVEDEYDQAADAPVTPTSSPVLFTYAPAEGKFDQLIKRLGRLKNKKLYHKLLIQKFFSRARGNIF